LKRGGGGRRKGGGGEKEKMKKKEKAEEEHALACHMPAPVCSLGSSFKTSTLSHKCTNCQAVPVVLKTASYRII